MLRMIKEIRKHHIPAYIWRPWLYSDLKAHAFSVLLFLLFSWGFIPLILIALLGAFGALLDKAMQYVWDKTKPPFENLYNAIQLVTGLDTVAKNLLAEQKANSAAWQAFVTPKKDETTNG